MILVTGATGFIGTNLVRQLVERGESVRILRRACSDMLGLEHLGVEEYVGDATDYDSVRRAMRGCGKVFHLAGSVSLSPFVGDKLRQINVTGAELMARAALDEGVERVVYTSSSVTIGYGTKERPADEMSEFNLSGVRLAYIQTKKEAEGKILDFCARGLPAVIVNPGYLFGAWDKTPKLNQLLILAAKRRLNFYFTGGLSVADVGDVARGHILAMEKGEIGQRYILSGENMTYREFFTRVNAVLGQKAPRFPLPYMVFGPMGLTAEICARLFRFEPTISRAVAQLYRINHFISSEKARRVLGYTTTPLDDSLGRAFDWLKEFHYI